MKYNSKRFTVSYQLEIWVFFTTGLVAEMVVSPRFWCIVGFHWKTLAQIAAFVLLVILIGVFIATTRLRISVTGPEKVLWKTWRCRI